MERDYFLDAQQALELGLVDKVLTTREEQDEVMKPLNAGKKDDGGSGRSGGNGDGGDKAGGGGEGQPPSPAINPSPS
jgi:hypothetical protein